jgi:hypothetical protein
MNHELLLCRAKHKDTLEWMEGYFVLNEHNEQHKYWLLQFSKNKAYQIPIDPETVCRNTGLEDCDGKRVWEWDIVYGYSGKALIEWGEDVGYGLTWSPIGNHKMESITGFIEEYRVIGNKFDHPELLTQNS